MPAHPHGPRPDPELWRAVHERPAAPTPWPFDRGSPAIAPHGMPADRLAMTASLRSIQFQGHHRSP